MIYGHTEWQPDPITPSQLAARLGLAPSTVTEMVKKLVAAGHVAHAPYGAVQLTAVRAGRGAAHGAPPPAGRDLAGLAATATAGTRCTTRPRCSSTR